MNRELLYGQAFNDLATIGRLADHTAAQVRELVASDDFALEIIDDELAQADVDPSRARGLRKERARIRPGPVDEPTEAPAGTVADVLAWVSAEGGDRAARARLALAAEQDRPSPRGTLVDELEEILEQEAD